ncbi:MAG: hypothetical protein OHK0046_21640 [Anaerolineae bacterium]
MRVLVIGVLVCLVLGACNLNSPQEGEDVSTLEALPSPDNIDTPELIVPTEDPLLPDTARTPLLPPTPQGDLPGAEPLLPESPVPDLNNTSGAADFPFPSVFPFSYDIAAEAGETIIISYDVTVNNPEQGRVFFIVENPEGEVIGQLVVTETAIDTFEVEAERDGTYLLRAASQNLSGDFTVSYNTTR